jgi:hypothetical protein
MNEREAEELLEGAELVTALKANIRYAREVLDKCLAAGIPAALARPEDCGVGCAPKLELVVRSDDAPRLAALLHREFAESIAREGTIDLSSGRVRDAGDGGDAAGESDELPCPACGFAGALVAGACADCGLVLE